MPAIPNAPANHTATSKPAPPAAPKPAPTAPASTATPTASAPSISWAAKLLELLRNAAKAIADLVRSHPWLTLGGTAALVLLLFRGV